MFCMCTCTHTFVCRCVCSCTALMLLVTLSMKENEQLLPLLLAIILLHKDLSSTLGNDYLHGDLPCVIKCRTFLSWCSLLCNFHSRPSQTSPLFHSLNPAFITLFSCFHSFIEAMPFKVFCTLILLEGNEVSITHTQNVNLRGRLGPSAQD